MYFVCALYLSVLICNLLVHCFNTDSVKTLVHQIEPQQIAVFSAQDAVKAKASSIRSLLNTHHRIMADIRTLLKTMTKVY